TQERVPAQSTLNPAAAGLANSVNDEFDGVAKSTWKWNVRYDPPPGNSTNVAGAPAGGSVEPTRSAGRKTSSPDPPVMPGVTKVAGKPDSILVLSKAKACGPRNAVPVELNTFMLM